MRKRKNKDRFSEIFIIKINLCSVHRILILKSENNNIALESLIFYGLIQRLCRSQKQENKVMISSCLVTYGRICKNVIQFLRNERQTKQNFKLKEDEFIKNEYLLKT